MKKYLVMVLVALGFAACTSSDDPVTPPTPTPDQPIVVNLAKTPDFQIYAGNPNNMIASTLSSTRAGEESQILFIDTETSNDWKTYNTTWGPYVTKKPTEYASDEEIAYVLDYINKHSDEGVKTLPEIDAWFFQNLGTAGHSYEINNYQEKETVVAADNMGALYLGGTNDPSTRGRYLNKFLTSPYYEKNAYGCLLLVNHSLLPITYTNTLSKSYPDDAWKVFVIQYNGKTNYYIGFDYRCHSIGDNPRYTYDGDDIYDDWVIKFIPASEPIPTETSGEVEVNLSLNAQKEKWDYVNSKLSMHVRAITDVELYLPVPEENYCEEDDMFIVQKHEAGKYVYNVEKEILTMDIHSNTVKLNIEYVKRADATTAKPEGIYISTEGINKTVTDYLYETYGDGLTFEIYNYYNGLERTGENSIQTLLNQSTIKFKSSTAPKTYVNAFAKILNYTGEVYGKLVTTENKKDDEKVDWYYPYKDKTFTSPLESQYYRRFEGEDSQRYYYLLGTKNPLDCIVTAPAAYQKKEEGNGSDNRNFNVYYEK